MHAYIHASWRLHGDFARVQVWKEFDNFDFTVAPPQGASAGTGV
jgi:hypothetical protein